MEFLDPTSAQCGVATIPVRSRQWCAAFAIAIIRTWLYDIVGSDLPAHTHHHRTVPAAFDTTDGPDGWIPRPGFADAVKEVQAAGVRIIPYTNGRVDDPNVASFKSDGAIRYMCNGSVGPYREEFNAAPRNISFFVPDPATDYWQQRIGKMAQKLAVDFGTDGVYVPSPLTNYGDHVSATALNDWYLTYV